MLKGVKRRRVALLASTVVILVTSLLAFSIYYSQLMDTRYGGQGFVEETGGLSYVSEKYDSNGNSTYSVTFHDVEFTFKYWYYPYGVQDYHYTAYFLIAFQDNTSEIISLATGSYWTTSGIVKRPLFAVTTNHTSPIAGVLSGDYLDNPVCWRFVVSIE